MATETGGARPYVLLSLLTVTNVLNFVDRQLLASFANFIVPDLQLTNTEFGLLTGLFFIIFYAVSGLFMGALADLVHRPRLIAGAVTAWSALTAASGAAVNFITLAIPRAIIGVGESTLTPAAMSLLADRFKASQLGFATGIYYLGAPLGAGLSLLVAGYLGPALGWRNCFYLLGAAGLALALLFLTIREARPPREHAHVGKPNLVSALALLLSALRRSPALCAVVLGGVALHWTMGATMFDQLWFVQERGFDRAEIARLVGYAAIAGGITGNIFGGVVSDWWQANMRSGRPMLLFWMMLVTVPLTILYRVVPPDHPLFWVGVFVVYFQIAAFFGPAFSTVQELAPPAARATTVGFYLLMLNVAGLGLGITLTGVLVDWLTAAGAAEPMSQALLSFTALSAVAAPAFFAAGRWFDRDKKRMGNAGV